MSEISSPRLKRIKTEEVSEDDDEDDEDDDDDGIVGGHVVKSRIGTRTDTEKLIARILCRWWYVLPPWPPSDYDWDVALRNRKLKLTPLDQWEQADDIDENGFTKVYPISPFEGIYRDPSGNAIDLRPLEGKPCYSTFKTKPPIELHELLINALKNQMAELRNAPYRITEKEAIERMQNNLALELRVAEESLTKLKRRKMYLDGKANGTMNTP